MFRVSLILKNAREDKDLNYAEVSKKIKVPAKYLEALENERLKDFPPDPYCSLIVKDYANFLGLNGDDVLTLFRRDFDRRSKNKAAKVEKVNVTPQLTFKIGLIVVVAIFIFYLVFEYIKFNQPPTLKVNWPDAPINNKYLEITGITDDEATVKINQDQIIVDQNGNFKKQVYLTPPETKIIIESKSLGGKTTLVEKIYK
jgi:hypothetical protein